MQITAPGSYYLTWDENRPLSDAGRQLREWLLATGKEAAISL